MIKKSVRDYFSSVFRKVIREKLVFQPDCLQHYENVYNIMKDEWHVGYKKCVPHHRNL